MEEGKYHLVVSAPGYRDFIYIGRLWREGDFLLLKEVTSVLFYRETGIAGLTRNSATATKSECFASVWVPIRSVASIMEVDEDQWNMSE